MTQKTKALPDQARTGSTSVRQVIVSVIALGIIALGGWSMWRQSAPYHPEIGPEQVSRNAAPVLSQTQANN